MQTDAVWWREASCKNFIRSTDNGTRQSNKHKLLGTTKEWRMEHDGCHAIKTKTKSKDLVARTGRNPD